VRAAMQHEAVTAMLGERVDGARHRTMPRPHRRRTLRPWVPACPTSRTALSFHLFRQVRHVGGGIHRLGREDEGVT
jgi:hypothetical protein